MRFKALTILFACTLLLQACGVFDSESSEIDLECRYDSGLVGETYTETFIANLDDMRIMWIEQEETFDIRRSNLGWLSFSATKPFVRYQEKYYSDVPAEFKINRVSGALRVLMTFNASSGEGFRGRLDGKCVTPERLF